MTRQLRNDKLHKCYCPLDVIAGSSGRAVRAEGLDRLDSETVGSNPA
jgi:hypothetical protein